MFKQKWSILGLLFFVQICALFANAQQGQPIQVHPGQIQTDDELVKAVRARQNQYYVEAGNLVATKMLKFDNSGRPHQRWEAKLSDGSKVTIVYNADMGKKVPLKEGDKFSVGGQFIWTKLGGLVHWVHDDPKKIRPDGYVYFNGVVYGDIDSEDQNSKP